MRALRIDPLILTIIIAILTAILVFAIAWVLLYADILSPSSSMVIVEGVNDTTNLTDPSLMARYLPMPPHGWEEYNTTAKYVNEPSGLFSFASGEYARPGTNITSLVVIYDSDGSDIVWNNIYKTGFIYESADGYARTYRYKNMPSWETARYAPDGNAYGMYVRLDDRYGMAITLKNATDSSPLRDFADRINIYEIRSLKTKKKN